MEYSYQFRIYPTKEQEAQIAKTLGCCRYVYNPYLAMRTEIYKDKKESMNYNACSKDMTELKKSLDWLKEVDSTALQSALKFLDTAYQNFFRRLKKGEKPGYPRFKRKHDSRQSYTSKCVGKNIQVLEHAVKLPKLGKVKCCISKQVQGRIANQRKDMLHKLSTKLIRENDIICMEDLAVKNMVKNHNLAKSIADASWGEFRRQLTYKAEWYGRKLVVIDRFYPSSQMCSACGTLWSGTKDLAVRKWTCTDCGTVHDRDVNAAKNILAEGLRMLA